LQVLCSSRHLEGFRAVPNGSAWRRRAARNRDKAAPIGVGFLAVFFGDVQPDRWRGATQSVSRVAIEVPRTLGGFVCPRQATDPHRVDIALLMAERQRFFDADYDNDNDNDNDCVRCSTCF
jgi:hypothetical protein